MTRGLCCSIERGSGVGGSFEGGEVSGGGRDPEVRPRSGFRYLRQSVLWASPHLPGLWVWLFLFRYLGP